MDENNQTNENQNFNELQPNNMPNPNNDLGMNSQVEANISPAMPNETGPAMVNPVVPPSEPVISNPVMPNSEPVMQNPVVPNSDPLMSNPVVPNSNPMMQNPVQQSYNQANVGQNPGGSNFNQVNTKTKTKGHKGLLIALVILVLVIVGALAFYFVVFSNSQRIIKGTLSNAFRSVENVVESKDFKTSKTYINLDANLDLGQDFNLGKYIDLINNTEISSGVQLDKESGKVLVQVGAKYEGEDMFNGKYLSDTKNEKTYLALEDVLDKVIEVDVEDSFYDGMRSLLNGSESTDMGTGDIKKALSRFEDEFVNIIKPEYCKKEKATIEVNGKSMSVNKNSASMTSEQFIEGFKEVLENLSKDKEFANCFSNPDEIKESLEYSASVLEATYDLKIEYNVYTTGLSANPVRVELVVDSNGYAISFNLTKVDDNNFEFQMLYQGTEVIFGTFKITKNNDSSETYELALSIYSVGTITVNMDYSVKYDEAIDNVDTSDAITYDELTTEDYVEIYNNLEDSKLGEFLEDIGLFGNFDLSGINIDDFDNGYDSDYPDDTNYDDTHELLDNEFLSFGDEYKITVPIPDGYVAHTSTDYRIYIEKDEDNIMDVTTTTTGLEETISTLKKIWSDREGYSLSGPSELEVGGRRFTYMTLKYDSEYIDLSTIYIYTELNDEDCIKYEISDPSKVTNDDLNELLKIKIEDYEE